MGQWGRTFFVNLREDIAGYVDSDSNTVVYKYDAWGNLLNPTEDDENPFRYAGEYFDEETGFIYLRNRYYDPSEGRFTTEDPIQDGLNWYVYCGNNPVMRIDPWGLWEEGDKKYKDSNPVVYAALGELTESWNNLNNLINSGTLSESQLISAKNHLKTIGALANIVRMTGDYKVVHDSSYDTSLYNGLNNTEKVIHSTIGIIGNIVGLAAENSTTDTQEYFGYDEDGSTQNAFKHALWNAYAVAYGAGEAYVKNFTDAHEFGNPNNFKSSISYESVRMDLHNNFIGRTWGNSHSPFTAYQMKEYMTSELKTQELWIQKNRNAK